MGFLESTENSYIETATSIEDPIWWTLSITAITEIAAFSFGRCKVIRRDFESRCRESVEHLDHLEIPILT
jgi:hypothetical protein